MQSPVRTGPGELLLLAGANLAADDDVVLRADSGLIVAGAEIIRAASDEQALVLRIPDGLDANRVYSVDGDQSRRPERRSSTQRRASRLAHAG